MLRRIGTAPQNHLPPWQPPRCPSTIFHPRIGDNANAASGRLIGRGRGSDGMNLVTLRLLSRPSFMSAGERECERGDGYGSDKCADFDSPRCPNNSRSASAPPFSFSA